MTIGAIPAMVMKVSEVEIHMQMMKEPKQVRNERKNIDIFTLKPSQIISVSALNLLSISPVLL